VAGRCKVSLGPRRWNLGTDCKRHVTVRCVQRCKLYVGEILGELRSHVEGGQDRDDVNYKITGRVSTQCRLILTPDDIDKERSIEKVFWIYNTLK
jgi:hypothetical protein